MKALIVLPTYNEAENLSRLAEGIFANAPNSAEILIIDDNSPDGTGKIADEMAQKNSRITVMHRPGKMGLGSAYVQGYKWALKRPYDVIIQMDCDFSHDPKDLPRLIDALAGADLAIGSRYVKGGSIKNWPWHRFLISRLGNLYARSIMQLGIKDMTGGYRAYKRNALESLMKESIVSEGYAFMVETGFHVVRQGFTVKEIPIIFMDRTRGKSKMSKKIIGEAMLMVLRLRLEFLLLVLTGLILLHYYYYFFKSHYIADFLPGLPEKLSRIFKIL